MLEREDLRQVRSVIKDVLREDHLDKLPDLFGREHHKHRGTHDLTFRQLVDAPDYVDNRQFITIVNEDEDGVAFIDLLGTDHQIVVTKNPGDFTLSADSQFHIYSAVKQPYIRISNISDTELDPALQFGLGFDDTIRFTIGVDDSDSNKLKIANQAALGAAFSSALQYGDVLYYNHFTGNLVAGIQLSDFVTDAVYVPGGIGSGDGEFSNARQVALNGEYIYIADDGNDRIQKFLASDGSFVSKTAVGVVTRPWGIVWWGGCLYVSCYAGALSDTIIKLDAETLAPLASFGEYGTEDGQLISPRSMTTDGVYLYICDWGNDRIKKHSFGGAYIGQVGSAGSGNGQFSGPCGIESDGTSLVVCDYGNQRIQKFFCSDLSFVSAVPVQTRGGNKGFPESITLNGINFYVGCGNAAPFRGYIEKYVIATDAFVAFYDPTATVGIDVDHVWGSFILKQAILAGDLIILHQDGSYLEIYPKTKFMDDVRFYEDVDPDGNYVGLRAPATVTADYALTLPAAAPAVQGHLYGEISGVLGWGQDVNSAASPIFVGLTLSGLTVSHPVFTDASNALVSTGTVPVDHGGTGLAVYAIGDLIYASAATTLARLADVAAASYLRSGGVGVAPLWSTLKLPNAATAFRLPVATSANTIGQLAAAGGAGEYLAGAAGAIPAWATLNQAAVADLTSSDGPSFDHIHLTVAIGTAPLVVTSTTLVGNLNADLLDGNEASAFAAAAHDHSGVYEPVLGNPASDGYVLSSTALGVRSWIPAGGALALNDLTDVNAPAPNDDDFLSWDAVTSKWIAVAGGGGAAHAILSATHNDSAAAAVVRGDVIIGSGVTPAWTRLAKGTSGYILTMGADEPAWAAPAAHAPQDHDLLSAPHDDTVAAAPVSGDILYGNATPAWTKLAKGSDGHYLKLVAGIPAWAAVAAGGGSDFLVCQVFS